MISVRPTKGDEPAGMFLVQSGWIRLGYYAPTKRHKTHDVTPCKLCDAEIDAGAKIYRHVTGSRADYVCAFHFDQIADNLADQTKSDN